MGNIAYLGNSIVADVVDVLASKLPSGWQAAMSKRTRRDRATAGSVDAILKIRRPGTTAGSVLIETKTRLEPKDVDYLAATLRPTSDQPVLIAAPFISRRSQ